MRILAKFIQESKRSLSLSLSLSHTHTHAGILRQKHSDTVVRQLQLWELLSNSALLHVSAAGWWPWQTNKYLLKEGAIREQRNTDWY